MADTPTAGNDRISGTAGNDFIDALAGDDDVFGFDGDDILFGGIGNDDLFGADGDDVMFGGAGNDKLFGDGFINGNDALNGGNGNDELSGLGGNDALNGGSGADVLLGGFGADRFVYFSTSDSGVGAASRDIIKDFIASDDRIDLSRLDARPSVAGNQAFTFINDGSLTAEGQVNVSFSNGNMLVGVNTDSDPAAEMQIALAVHVNFSEITASNFIL
jgi:serralysin